MTHLTDPFAADRLVCEKATAGPWRPGRFRSACIYASEADDVEPVLSTPSDHKGRLRDSQCGLDRNFAIAARTRWPAALDEIAKLRAALHQILSTTSEPVIKKFAEEALR